MKAPPLTDGKSFSQYEAVFLQLADEHRTVNAFELQELLDACLPNGNIYLRNKEFTTRNSFPVLGLNIGIKRQKNVFYSYEGKETASFYLYSEI